MQETKADAGTRGEASGESASRVRSAREDGSEDEKVIVGEPSDEEDADIVLPLDVIPELKNACLDEEVEEEQATSKEAPIIKQKPKPKEEAERRCKELTEVEYIGTAGKKITLIEGLDYCTNLEVCRT